VGGSERKARRHYKTEDDSLKDINTKCPLMSVPRRKKKEPLTDAMNVMGVKKKKGPRVSGEGFIFCVQGGRWSSSRRAVGVAIKGPRERGVGTSRHFM